MSDTILRPGIALGPYPERLERRPGVLDRIAARATGFVTQRRGIGAGRLDRVTGAVDAHAGRLRRAGDEGLHEEVRELRVRLRTRGLRDDLVAHAFALVRECADRALGMRHHDAQLAGGWAMIHGMLAEMETGEGKTLTATLPACTAALAGIPVHVITVNDYLVTRDVEWMSPVYRMLGISTGAITEALDAPARRAAYACDVTYCSNKQIAFDYLKDRIVLGNSPGRLRLELEHIYSDDPRLERLLLRG
ncbi:MAG: prepilin peptidase, partial [Gammaproteobacteria bacterium]|nr:prepilin peptidase [Gammaproteobacteria bacterium]